MKKFLLFLTLTCAAVAQVSIDIGDIAWPASSANQVFRRNAANNAYEFVTLSPVITLGTDATGSVTLTNLGSATLNVTVNAATTSAAGKIELATDAETFAGTDTGRVAPISGLEARMLRGTSSRANLDGLYFDGVTSGARAYWSLGSVGAIGTGDLTLGAEFVYPTAAPASSIGILYLGPLSSSLDVRTLVIDVVVTSGDLRWRLYGATGSDNRAYVLPGALAAYGGRIISAHAVRTSSGLIPYVNGMSVAGLVTESTAGTPPSWADTITSTYLVVGAEAGGQIFLGSIFKPTLINRALSAAELLRFVQTGRLPSNDDMGTGNMVQSAVANSSFETDTASAPSGWYHGGNHAGTAVADGTAPGGSNVLEIVASAAGSQAGSTDHVGQSSYGNPQWYKPGRRYRLSYWAKSISGNTSLTVGIGGGSGWVTPAVTVTASWQQFFVEATMTAGAGNLRISLGGAGTVRVDKVEIIELGPVIKPVVQPSGALGGSLRDSGANRIAGVYTAGATPLTDGNRGVVRARLTWAGTHESKALIADQALIPDNALIESVTVVSDVSTTGSGISIGDGDTTSYWVATTALTANTKTYLTLAKRYPASAAAADLKFYVDPDTVNITTNIDVTITYSLVY